MDRVTLERLLAEVEQLGQNVERIRRVLSEALGRPATADPASTPAPVAPRPDEGGGVVSIERARSAGSVLSVLDLSGDVKRVQLSLLRLGTATLEQLVEATGLSADELKTYLKTLERQETVTRVTGDGGVPAWRPVLQKRRASAGSLLDKLG